MVIEFTVTLENRPGTLAAALEVLEKAGVNIQGMLGMICAGEGINQLVTNDPDRTAEAFKAAGVKYMTREVLVVNMVNQPGGIARVVRAMAAMGINIDGIYITTDDGLALGVDNLPNARLVAAELGIIKK